MITCGHSPGITSSPLLRPRTRGTCSSMRSTISPLIMDASSTISTSSFRHFSLRSWRHTLLNCATVFSTERP